VKKILNLEWAAKGRDINIVEPVLTYLEKTQNYNIVRDSIHNAFFKILKNTPDVVIITSVSGARRNFEINKICSLLGVKLISFTSEGDFRADDDFEVMFWGWNTDKIMYEDLLFIWSDRVKNLIKKIKSLNQNDFKKIKVPGYTGIDRYFMNLKEKKIHFDNSYKKIILITAFNFDQFGEESWGVHKKEYNKILPKETIDSYDNIRVNFYRKSSKKVNEIYKQLIEESQDIFFILKTHPAMINLNETEFSGIYSKNCKIIQNEYDISQLIISSDLTISFESTTCLESWLLKKPTLLLNPYKYPFSRSIVSGGSPILKSYTELRNKIDEFVNSNRINAFEKLEKKRKIIIHDVIKFSDGHNYVRAANDIVNFLENGQVKKRIIKLSSISLLIKEFVKLVLLNSKFKFFYPKFYKSQLDLKQIYNEKDRKNLIDFYYKNIDLNLKKK
jgi:surface carbohydrate biosynthesis protein